MFNSYTEEFKRNAVAVVKSGISEYNLARRLGIPPTSIRNWVKNKKYSMVEPATEEMLANIPEVSTIVPKQGQLIQINKGNISTGQAKSAVKLHVGKMEIEVDPNTDKQSLVIIFKTLEEAGVL